MIKEDLEETAYRMIIQMILKHRYRPGEFLLETELAEELKLSRTPVRQALRRLTAEGFLEKKRKRGCLIPLPHPTDAQQVFFAREVIESQTAAASARNATDADIKKLRSLLQKEEKIMSSNNKAGYSLINEQFHMGIANASRNEYLKRYCTHIFWRANSYLFFFDSFYSRPDTVSPPTRLLTPAQHKRILDAIAGRDPESAASAMKEHIRCQYDVMLKPWNYNGNL